MNPSLLGYGSTVTIKGTGFAPRINVTINVRRPNGLPTAHWTALRANRSGGFRYVRVVARSADTGRYVAVACQRTCRIKATAAFRIVKVQPL